MMAGPVMSTVSRTCPSGSLGRIRYAGRMDASKGLPNPPPRRFDAFGLMYVWHGEGVYRAPHHLVNLRPGDLVYVVPNLPHWYGVRSDGWWSEVFLVFEGPVFDLCLRQGLIDPARPVRHLPAINFWRDRLDSFRTRQPARKEAEADAEVCQLLRLLVDIAAEGEVGNHREEAWVGQSELMLRADPAQPLKLHEIAASIGMPYETWRRRFRDAVGVAPARYRLRYRLDLARHLLRQTSMPIADVATSLGFTDESHFARHFRTYVGMTAGQYRRSSGALPQSSTADGGVLAELRPGRTGPHH